jgi:hypothetical protein
MLMLAILVIASLVAHHRWPAAGSGKRFSPSRVTTVRNNRRRLNSALAVFGRGVGLLPALRADASRALRHPTHWPPPSDCRKPAAANRTLA